MNPIAPSPEAHVRPRLPAPSPLTPQDVYQALLANVEQAIHGQRTAVRRLLVALASEGHVLLEDFPGTGKTTLAKALSRSIDATFRRIQFTPDLLPSDILGVSIFNQRQQNFEYHEGPIFTSILLADEINRASPRTQSALLEAMAEGQVTIDGERRALPGLFFVIATQNPVEFRGTYPLPEAQMDRFALQFALGYVEADQEVAILNSHSQSPPLERVKSIISTDDVLSLRHAARQVRVSDELKRYIVDLTSATRHVPGVQLGASPRASLALMKAAQAAALFNGSTFVTPEHIQEMAIPVIAHRLGLEPQARFSGQTAAGMVTDLLKRIPVPV